MLPGARSWEKNASTTLHPAAVADTTVGFVLSITNGVTRSVDVLPAVSVTTSWS